MPEGILRLLCRKYAELEEACYRAATASRSSRGRLRGRYALPDPLVRKLDLDEALERLVDRFFGAPG